jgi:predicted nucleic acid-binding protein
VIILDTNVLSALMRATPDPVVTAWLDAQPSPSVWTTAITVLELTMGIELLPEGRRRHDLERACRVVLAEDLDGRVLPFDADAAIEAGRLAARRQQAGRPVEFRDTQIAGIALARRATLATRNLRHFADLPVAVIDPWAG